MAAVFFGFAFDKTKFAAHLRMVVERLRLAQNKRTQEIKQERREVSGMLAAKKMDKARVRVESVLRKTREGEASDILTVVRRRAARARARARAGAQSAAPELFHCSRARARCRSRRWWTCSSSACR